MTTYAIPYVTTRTPQGERTVDIYSRLLADRIVYLGTGIDEGVANAVIAQLLHLENESPDAPIALYLNSVGGSIPATLAIYDAMQFVRPSVETTCVGQAVATGFRSRRSHPADPPTCQGGVVTSLESLTRTLGRLVDAGELAGWVAGVGDRDGQTVRTGGRRAADGPPMTTDTQFALSSNTKPLGGVLVLRLAERGVLHLDDPIERWLAQFAQPRVLTSPGAALDDSVPAGHPITVRHLLTMTPGFGWVSEPGPLSEAMDEQAIAPGPWGPPMGPDEFVSRLGDLPLANQPGTAWRYHTSSDVLGVLLARATRSTVGELLAEHVLAPLGMTGTSFVGDPARMATAYGPADEGGLAPFPVPPGTFTQAPPFESLAAGLVSTVPDQLTFLRSLVGSAPALLSSESLDEMRTNHIGPDQRATAEGFLEPGSGWGHHVEIRANGPIGWAGGLGTIGYADPRTGRAAFLATQVSFDAPGTAAAFDAFWPLLD